MRGQIKRILLLLLLLAMIYCQHSPVIHAEGGQGTSEERGSTDEENSGGEQEESQENPGQEENEGDKEGPQGSIPAKEPEMTKVLDTQAPKICIAGVFEDMAARRDVEISCRIFEEHQLEAWSAKVEWRGTDGNKRRISEPEWKIGEGIAETLFALSEDGSYCLKVSARDVSGNFSKEEVHFTIKRQQPSASLAENGESVKKAVSDAAGEELRERKPGERQPEERQAEERKPEEANTEKTDSPQKTRKQTAVGAGRVLSAKEYRQDPPEYRAVQDMPPVSVKKYDREDDGEKEQPGDRREGAAWMIPAAFGLILVGDIWYRRKKKSRSVRPDAFEKV